MSNYLIKCAMGVSLLMLIASCSVSPDVTRTSVDQQRTQKLSSYSRMFQRDVTETVYFASGEDILDEEAKRILDEQATWIKAHPSIRFSVFGHTDRVGTSDDNAALGMRRAEQVVSYLVTRGVDKRRLSTQATYGEDMPLVDTQRAEAANRRATTFVTGHIETAGASSGSGPALSLANSKQKPAKLKPSDKTDTDRGDDNYGEKTETANQSDSGDDSEEENEDNQNNEQPDEGDDSQGEESNDNIDVLDDVKDNKGNKKDGKKEHMDAGRGNGGDSGDPGKSGGKNNGGDADDL